MHVLDTILHIYVPRKKLMQNPFNTYKGCTCTMQMYLIVNHQCTIYSHSGMHALMCVAHTHRHTHTHTHTHKHTHLCFSSRLFTTGMLYPSSARLREKTSN